MNRKLYQNLFNWKFLFSITISILFANYAFKNFDIQKFISILDELNYLIIIAAVILLIISVYIRALRWKLLLDSEKISLRLLFDSQMIGYFGNNIFPLRFGELLRCFFISKNNAIKMSNVFGTVIIERILDMLGVIMLVIILAFLNFNLLIQYDNKFYLSLLGLAIGLIIFISFYLNKKQILYHGNNKIFLTINNILDGFRSLNKRNLYPVFIYTILIWCIYIIEVYLVQFSMHLSLTYSQCIFLLIISSLALSIPSSPANIGTFEAGVLFALSIIGITENSIEFAVLLHSMTFFPYTIIGGFLFIYNYYYVINSD